MASKILIVDDQPADLACTEMVLAAEPEFQLVTTTSPDEALSLVKSDPEGFSAILLDYQMPTDGLTLARSILAINPQAVVALLSADQSRDVLKKCLSAGVSDFIEKDQDEEVIRSVARALCRKWEAQPKVARPTPGGNDKIIASLGLVGRSAKMAELAKTVQKVAPLEASLFLHGESGVGKELIARAVHHFSPRRGKPFVAINIAAIPDNLAESELFGHVKGAFTGADRPNEGKLFAANGGTLFLDEIGDLKPEIQVKLLRVLQERKITPVGGNKPVNLDVRLISATHVDLEAAIRDGRFREDLYFRLHVVPLVIPPLRERTEDIEPLVFHFLKIYGGENRRILTKTIQLLERYHWRGNVRELENEIQRLIAVADRTIEPSHLNEKIRRACGLTEIESPPTFAAFTQQRDEMELEYIRSNVARCGSMREACRSIFKAPVSSIHTRLKILEQGFNQKREVLHDERA